jgi:hypothetical protein
MATDTRFHFPRSFEPMSTLRHRVESCSTQSELIYTGSLPSVPFGAQLLKAHYHIFLQLNSRRHSPYITSSLKSGWVCLLRTGLAFVKYVYVHVNILPSALYTNPLSVQAFKSRSCLSYLSHAITAAYSPECSWAWPPPSLRFPMSGLALF